jgi:uncharacterized protein YwlG (UPF0340 family)
MTAAAPNFPCRTCEVRDKAICTASEDDELRQLNKISTIVKLDAGGNVSTRATTAPFCSMWYAAP